MTAEDVVYSYSHWITNTKHARASALQRFWDHPEGSIEIVDSHTLMVNTGEPMPDVIMSEFHRVPSGIASWIVSKKQSDEIGIEAADKDIAGTGPWEIVEHRPAQYWRMKAVQDHWRQDALLRGAGIPGNPRTIHPAGRIPDRALGHLRDGV